MTPGAHKRGVTFVEVLVVIAIAAALMLLLLPAIQSARESARVTTCSNNLRQIGHAILNYSQANQSRLPAGWRTIRDDRGQPQQIAVYHYFLSSFSWRTSILPYLEDQPLHDRMDFSSTPIAASNLSLVSVSLPIFQCPSTPGYPRSVIYDTHPGMALGANDYVHVHTVGKTELDDPNQIGNVAALPGAWYGLIHYQHLRFGDNIIHATERPGARNSAPLRYTTDGYSKTLLIAEKAGFPNVYVNRDVVEVWAEGVWATPEYGGFGKARVNWSNFPSIYGFHTGGAHVAYCDASVQFLSEDTATDVIVALCSRHGDDTR